MKKEKVFATEEEKRNIEKKILEAILFRNRNRDNAILDSEVIESISIVVCRILNIDRSNIQDNDYNYFEACDEVYDTCVSNLVS